jgi:hypothetical protein
MRPHVQVASLPIGQIHILGPSYDMLLRTQNPSLVLVVQRNGHRAAGALSSRAAGSSLSGYRICLLFP